MRQVLIAGAALALAAVVASPVVATTSATRPPTTKERVILDDLVRAYVESTCCDGIKRIKIDNVLVSVADARWAEVNMQAWDKTLAYLGGQTAVLHKGVATGHWALLYLGGRAAFCKPPPKVRRDLGLVCPNHQRVISSLSPVPAGSSITLARRSLTPRGTTQPPTRRS